MRPVAKKLLFPLVFGALTLLAAAPFWRTRLLPMQDYPHFLVFVRAFTDLHDPRSPFAGTYTTGFPLSPVVLPMVLARALAAWMSIEQAGRVLWTLYAVGLPLASLHLLRVLGRSPWAVLLVFPLVISYWVIGGFFAFATAAPLFVLGLACAVRWFEAPTWWRGLALAAVACALHLWHALAFAQLLLDVGVLWLLFRFDGVGARLRALLPLAPPLALFAAWILATVQGHGPGARAPTWGPIFEIAGKFFDYVGPIVPGGVGATMVLGLLLLTGALTRPALPPARAPFRVRNPFAWLALLAVVCFTVFPTTCFGVEGILDRQAWIAALLFVFGWSLPALRRPRVVLLAVVAAAGAGALLHLGSRFAAFDRETAGASRLIDRLGPGQTLLAPITPGSSVAFPGKPLVALDLYASVRHGGLPNASFAGYGINVIRYVGGKNPMPGIVVGWLNDPALTRFDYVLLRGVPPKSKRLQPVAEDGDWKLLAVCGGRVQPSCP